MAGVCRTMRAPGREYRPQESLMKRIVTLLLLSLFSVAVLSGCNTVKGFGKDVQKVGEKVEDSSGK
jgi:predicted small secreted protein